jgi:hypothetical protein
VHVNVQRSQAPCFPVPDARQQLLPAEGAAWMGREEGQELELIGPQVDGLAVANEVPSPEVEHEPSTHPESCRPVVVGLDRGGTRLAG